jgi:hypothetical protein
MVGLTGTIVISALDHHLNFQCTDPMFFRGVGSTIRRIFLPPCAMNLELSFFRGSSSSKHCFDFFELSSTELEQVCVILRLTFLVKLLT